MVFYMLLFLVLLLISSGFFFSQVILYIALKTEEKMLEYEINNDCFDKKWFKIIQKGRVIIKSPFGYSLVGYFLPADRKTANTVIFCHGVTLSHICSIKYAQMFHRRGWNVFLYDHRRHGGSEGNLTSYGYYEKHDLKAMVDYLRTKINRNAVIGLHGESMGAATILQYGGMNDNVDFYIADCSYSSFWGQLSHVLKTRYHLPVFPFLYLTDLFVRIRGKFRLRAICPLEDVKKIKHPVLFIHGDEDTYVPTQMSVDMFEAKKGFKQIYLAAGATHAQSMKVDPDKYENTVFSFLTKAGI